MEREPVIPINSIPFEKQLEKAKLDALVDEYLANGGVIDVLDNPVKPKKPAPRKARVGRKAS